MDKTVKPRTYLGTFAALMALLALTWALAYVNLGHFNFLLGLAIALTKAVLIALFFMHLRGARGLLFLAAISGVVWLLILLGSVLSDYATRP